MRIVFATVLVMHGIAHLVGFFGAWGPSRTTAVELGPRASKVLGVGWLLGAIAFGVAAVAAMAGITWWPGYTLVVAAVSFVMCAVQLPDTRLGLVLNAIVAAGVLAGAYASWW